MTTITNPGSRPGDDALDAPDRRTRPPTMVEGCSTKQDLKDTIAVAIMAHGLPEVERAVAHFRRRLRADPATALDDPRPKRKPRRPWGSPPYETPEEATR